MINKAREENEHISLEIKNGILYAFYKNGNINLEQAKAIVEFRLKYSEYKAFKTLITSDASLHINKEAREYFSSEYAQQLILAGAIVTTNPLTAFLANLIIKLEVTKFLFPCRLFSSQEAALKWLKSNIDNKEQEDL